MPNLFTIVKVDPDERESDEQTGSKNKFWLTKITKDAEESWLFKYSREYTGEHWAEKIASEIARLVKLPSAEVELAEFEGIKGCVSKSFVGKKPEIKLIHGNEMLAGHIRDYDPNKTFKQSRHTLVLLKC